MCHLKRQQGAAVKLSGRDLYRRGIVKKTPEVLRLFTSTELRTHWKFALVAGSHMGGGLHTRHPPHNFFSV